MMKKTNVKMRDYAREKIEMKILSNKLSRIERNTKWHMPISEIDYEENCEFFTKSGIFASTGIHYILDNKTNVVLSRYINLIIEEYILTKFTINELYIIFFENIDDYILSTSGLKLAKKNAIESINNNIALSADEKKKMKRKVWNTDYLIYGLIFNYIERYEIFWDNEKGEVISPN